MPKLNLKTLTILLIIAALTSCGGSNSSDSPSPSEITYDITLIKTDGTTEVETTATPIPLGSKIRATFSEAISDSGDRTTIEEAVSITDSNSSEVAGTFSWSEDYTELTFTPTKRFKYQTTYTITISEISESISKALSPSISGSTETFSTMLKGDINGDGFAEKTAVAPTKNTSTGAAYIYNGSAEGIGESYTAKFSGADTGDILGSYIATADVNGDGYSDLILPVPGANSMSGVVYIYHGSSDGISSDSTPNTTLAAQDNDTYFGWNIANAGDVNGDGFDDILIGAPAHTDSAAYQGAAYLYNGSANGISSTASPTFTVTGTTTEELIGIWVEGLGDINNDGYDDFTISALVYEGDSFGAVRIFLGSNEEITTPSTILSGSVTDGYMGRVVCGVGDINGDGYTDAAMVAAGDENGKTFVYYGSSTGISSEDKDTIPNPAATEEDTFSCASLGDFNGDGYNDLAVGNQAYSSNKGITYVYQGTSEGINTTAAYSFEGTESDSLSGTLFPARDINGDGYYDMIIGSPGINSYTGTTTIYLGSSEGFDEENTDSTSGEEEGDRFDTLLLGG